MEHSQDQPEPAALSWSAATVHDHERSTRWYVVGACAVLACAVYGVLSGSWTFSVVILLFAFLYFLLRNHPAPIRTFRITEKGVQFENIFTPFSDLREFWIIVTPLGGELHITKKKGLNREIVIHTGALPLDQIRSTLGQALPERADRKERLVDKIIRICKL